MIRILLMVAIVCIPISPVMAKAKAKETSKPNNKYASIIIDFETGAILSQSNPTKKLHPASLTKVMTLLLLFEAMESGNVRLNSKIPISKNAAAQQPSKIGLAAGSSIRVEDAILSLVTKSANDISVAIAEYLGGSEGNFAKNMTTRAKKIGMESTVFKNASGLHHPNQITTARDMALMARYIINRYPNYYRYFGTKQFTYRGKTMTNHNRLMQTYPGMDGFKTGFINASGFNLIASAKHGNKRLIGVVFGGRTTKSRNDHMAELLNRGFSNFSDVKTAQSILPTQPTPILKVDPPASAAPESVTIAAIQTPVYQNNAAPPLRPILKTTSSNQPAATGQVLQLPSDYNQQPRTPVTTSGFTSLSSLDEGRRIAIPQEQNAAQSIGDWSIQIGAYASRMTTDDALRMAQAKLPPELSHASRLVVPMETSGGYLFRARLGGLSQDEARKACLYFRDCLAIAP